VHKGRGLTEPEVEAGVLKCVNDLETELRPQLDAAIVREISTVYH